MQKKRLRRLPVAGLLLAAFFIFPLMAALGNSHDGGTPGIPGSQEAGGPWATDNLNVLFLGFEAERLEMVAVYSINHRDRMQSGAVFFPLEALVPGEVVTFRDYYREQGLQDLRSMVEESLGIEIAYYVSVRNAIMDEVERITGPIIIEGEKLDLTGIFTMAPGPRDEEMLGELVKRLTKPEVYFWQLPKLCLAAHRHVTTDFPLTLENLLLHYRIATRIPTHHLKKVILSLEEVPTPQGPAWQLNQSQLERIIYEITR